MKDPVKITLDGKDYELRWNRGAVFRADELGIYNSSKSVGLADGAKYVFAMLPEDARRAYPTPAAVFEVLPALPETWAAINAALKAGAEDTDPKKLFGSTNSRSRSSSSA